jgi:hypothetical protein
MHGAIQRRNVQRDLIIAVFEHSSSIDHQEGKGTRVKQSTIKRLSASENDSGFWRTVELKRSGPAREMVNDRLKEIHSALQMDLRTIQKKP